MILTPVIIIIVPTITPTVVIALTVVTVDIIIILTIAAIIIATKKQLAAVAMDGEEEPRFRPRSESGVFISSNSLFLITSSP